MFYQVSKIIFIQTAHFEPPGDFIFQQLLHFHIPLDFIIAHGEKIAHEGMIDFTEKFFKSQPRRFF